GGENWVCGVNASGYSAKGWSSPRPFRPLFRQGESPGRPAQAAHVISTSSAPDGRLELCDGSAGQRHFPCYETIASLLLPARLSRETPFQAIEIYCLLATL